MSKEDIKRTITDICDNRLKALGEYEFFKDASLEIKFWRVTGLVNNDIEGIIDRCEESRLNTLLSEFTYYIPSGSAFESSDDPGPGPDPHDYSKDYFTIVALENTAIDINVPDGGVSYSLDGGTTWSEGSGSFSFDIQNGERVLIKGDVEFNPDTSLPGPSFIQSTGNYSVEGNIMSLSYEDDFVDKKTIYIDLAYYHFFINDTKLISAENLVLPATTLTSECYNGMFDGCTALTTAPKILPATELTYECYLNMFANCSALTTAPELPATTLTQNCYERMFSNCTSLTTAPELLATTLAYGCYYNMFFGCTSLTTAPELPATTLAEYCYASMFEDCSSLTTAPELPATTLVSKCYDSMFQGCTNLNYIKALFLTTPDTEYTYNWVSNVSATGTFVRNENATWNVRGANGIPEDWDVEPPFEQA